jgi:hypothetical protein
VIASSCTQFTLALLILAGVVIESSLSQLHTLACSKPIQLGVLRSGVISTGEELREWPESEHCVSRKNHRHKRHHNRGRAAANIHLSRQCVYSAARLPSSY